MIEASYNNANHSTHGMLSIMNDSMDDNFVSTGSMDDSHDLSARLSLPQQLPSKEPLTGTELATLIALCLVTLAAFSGSLLIIVSVCVNRRLRTVTNYFLTSLAVADCLVSVLVLPGSVYVSWQRGTWVLGRVACDIWTSADVLLCTASILNLAAISVDRYLAIVFPIAYRAHRSRKLATAMIGFVWLLAAVITSPPLLFGWRGSSQDPVTEEVSIDTNTNLHTNNTSILSLNNHIDIDNTSASELDLLPQQQQCTLVRNQGYIIYSAVGSFFLPLLIMLFVYARIFHIICKRERRLRLTRRCSTIRRQQHQLLLQPLHYKSRSAGENHSTDVELSLSHPNSHTQTRSIRRGMSTIGKQSERQKQFAKMEADKKAATTLAVVVGCFTVCWLPFFTGYLIEGLCTSCTLSPSLSEAFTWLGYANSALNPLIYACYSKDFRDTFYRLTCGAKCRR